MIRMYLLLISFISLIALRASAADPNTVTFPKGTLTLQTYGTYAHGFGAKADIGSAAAGVGYFIRDDLSLSLEASGYRVSQPGKDAWMYGLSGVLRHHLLHFDRGTLFADVSFGPIESTHRVPQDGTYFNFATRTGLGITYQLKGNMHLLTGVRYFHISNAHIEGRQRNPSINGVEGFLGLMWTF
jgi:hypothetical protein